MFIALIIFIITFAIIIYTFWLKPTMSIIENSKNIYHSSLETMNTTYGTQRVDSEKAAKNALDKWNEFTNKMYKIIIESLLFCSIILFNYFNTINNKIFKVGFHIIVIGLMIFEYFSNIIDNGLKKLFSTIDKSASKNTKDNTGKHHKLLAIFISSAMCIASILGKIKYGDNLFLSSALVSLILTMLTLFNAYFNKNIDSLK
jgi:cation transport ATPase